MDQKLTLKEAGTRLGVTGKALKRLIRSGVLPEAHKVSLSAGRAWVIPADALPAIAERQGWVIDLRGDEPLLDVEAGFKDGARAVKVSDDELVSQGPSHLDSETGVAQTNLTPITSVRPDGVPTDQDRSEIFPSLVEQPLKRRSDQDTSLAPEYETIRRDRLSPQRSTAKNSEKLPRSTGMADVYDLNAAHETKQTGAKDAMTSITISHNSAHFPDSPTNKLSRSDEASGTDADLSDSTELTTVGIGELIPHRTKQGSPTPSDADIPSLSDVLDVALLDRLLGAQEEKANALAVARQSEASLTSLNERNEQALSELEVIRQQANLTSDRLSEERMARIVADAKVAELRDRVIREMTLADSEKQARVEATMRNIQAERENANAYASMGWRARRRYRRLNKDKSGNQTSNG